jgi:hypothetical protein
MRYKSIGARRRAVTAFAVNAAARLNPGVGESSMSNNVGSGRANVAARRLLNHVSIPSNNTIYTKVEFEPILFKFIVANHSYLSIFPKHLL